MSTKKDKRILKRVEPGKPIKRLPGFIFAHKQQSKYKN